MPNLKLLGGVVLADEDGPVEGPVARRHPLALLALLAVAPARSLSRAKLVGYLWPDAREAKARNRLNTHLHHLRRQLGEDVLTSSGDELRLSRERLSCDVWAFEDALESETWERAVDLYEGPFLDGFRLKNTPTFGKWVDRERDRLARSYRAALEALAERAEERGEPAAAAGWWRKRVNEDPYDSRVIRRLMEALTTAGNPAAALRVARTHIQLVREELGTEPSPKVRELAERIEAGEAEVGRAASPPAGEDAAGPETATGAGEAGDEARAELGTPAGTEGPDRRPAATTGTPGDGFGRVWKVLAAFVLIGVVAAGWYLLDSGGVPPPEATDRSVAVLPFDAIGTENPGPVAEGIHTDLLTRLSNVSGLRVIARTAVEPYRDTELSTGEVVDSLGVRWVLEGAVQKTGEQIQVNVQLIDPRSDTQAWADTYRRDLTAADLFDLQSDITTKIARSLEAELSPEETERVERQPTENLEAYRLYVQGRKLLAQRRVKSIREATGFFERALRRDSAYALAWAGLADARVLTAMYDGELSDERKKNLAREALVSARRARKLNPDLAEAWTALGATHVYEERNRWKEGRAPVALQELRRAVALKPSYAHAHQWLADLYLTLGRPERGLEHASLAVELDPEHAAARQVLMSALVANDQTDDLWSHYQKLPRRAPMWRAFALYHTGRWDELEALAREHLEEGTGPHFILARIAALRGDTAAAREHLADIREAEDHVRAGLAHTALGETDEAFSAWAKVEEWRAFWPEALRYWFADIVGPLRDDPRYRELIRKVNMAWGLNPDGSIPDSVSQTSG